MSEKIKLSTFVKEYDKLNSEQLKDKYIKGHITSTYCPILKKKYLLEIMNEKSVEEGVYGKYIDLVVSKINFIMTILALYTDIAVDKNEEGVPLSSEAYDILKSKGVLTKLINFIGEDVEELVNVQSQIMDTWYNQNTGVQAYISNLIEKTSYTLGISAGAGMDKLAEVLSDEKKMNKMMGVLDKIMKRI